MKGSLSTSQTRAVMKFLEKKDRRKQFIKNWRPNLLLNVDTKKLSKAFAAKLIATLPSIISSNQMCKKSGRLTSDMKLAVTKISPGIW